MNYKGIKDKKFSCQNCGSDIPFKHYRKTEPKFCSKKCQMDIRWIEQKGKIERGEVVWSETQRKYLSEKRGYKCEICSTSEWCDSELTLQVDHIDGNPDHNLPSNLRLLCPNCHSQTPTYKGGNKKTPKMDRRSMMMRNIYGRRSENRTQVKLL